MIKLAPQLINLFATLILMLSFAMISQRRIVSLINLFTIQGAALVAASVLLGYVTHQPDLYVSAALTLLLKVIFIPWMLHRVIRKLNVRWDVDTLINIPTTMLVGIALVIFSFRKQHVILHHLSRHLAADRTKRFAKFRGGHFSRKPAADAQVLDRHAPLEQQREDHRNHRLRKIERLPALFRKHPQQAVADVVVHAADIGPRVMAMVVGLAPVVAGAGDIPLVGLAVEMRVAHPVVLTMHDVVAQLHVFENLREREQQRSEDDRGQRRDMEHGPQQAAADRAAPQQHATEASGPAHAGNDCADVVGVALTDGGGGACAYRIECVAEAFEFVGGQCAVCSLVGHGCGHRSRTRSLLALLTHSRSAETGSRSTAPVCRWRVLPARLPQAQVLQMPMRQPDAGFNPAASSAASSDVPRGTSSVRPLAAKVIRTLPVASSTAARGGGVNASA